VVRSATSRKRGATRRKAEREPHRAEAIGAPGAAAAVLGLQRTIGNQATVQLLQRKFSAVPGPETGNRNVLEQVAKASSQLGYTYPVLNGGRVGSTSEMYKMMKTPTVEVTPKQGVTNTFRGLVTEVGTNIASYELEYPDPKQKTGEQKLTRGELADAIVGLRKILGGSLALVSDEDVAELRRNPTQAATLVVKADFTLLSKQTLEHERRHAADHDAVFTKILGGWDRLLELAQRSGMARDVKAKDASSAEDELWRPAGGSPVEIAEKIWKELVRRSDAFHATPEGAEAKVKSVTWGKDAAHLEFELDPERGQGRSNLMTPVSGLKDKPVIELLD
jgi:hypothetical protein